MEEADGEPDRHKIMRGMESVDRKRCLKSEGGRFNEGLRKNSFSRRVAGIWNTLPEGKVEA